MDGKGDVGEVSKEVESEKSSMKVVSKHTREMQCECREY